MDIELTDVATGQKFRISDFKGKTILLESFAVWCPTCLRQQQEMKKLVEMEDDDIIHISLDTDPHEDEAQIREHLERNNLNWYFAISPVELTNALTEDFGLIIISASSAPVILICPDQSTRFLGRGIKLSDKLLAEVQRGCT
jgi:thiol-disulfide isomerase/thioredoxin